MKAKLLKKLRKRIFIAKRNKEYKVIDVGNGVDSYYSESKWMSYKKALRERREWIIDRALLHKKPKQFLTK